MRFGSAISHDRNEAFGLQRAASLSRSAAMASSVIRSFVYSQTSRLLVIRFVNDTVYVYEDVPTELVDQLSDAPSKGRYFVQHIRDKFISSRLRSR